MRQQASARKHHGPKGIKVLKTESMIDSTIGINWILPAAPAPTIQDAKSSIRGPTFWLSDNQSATALLIDLVALPHGLDGHSWRATVARSTLQQSHCCSLIRNIVAIERELGRWNGNMPSTASSVPTSTAPRRCKLCCFQLFLFPHREQTSSASSFSVYRDRPLQGAVDLFVHLPRERRLYQV